MPESSHESSYCSAPGQSRYDRSRSRGTVRPFFPQPGVVGLVLMLHAQEESGNRKHRVTLASLTAKWYGRGDGLYAQPATLRPESRMSTKTARLNRLEFSSTLQAFHCYLISCNLLIINLYQTCHMAKLIIHQTHTHAGQYGHKACCPQPRASP